jgi:hypothetical protein
LVVATIVPSPNAAASAKQATTRIRKEIVGSWNSVNARKMAPSVAKRRGGWCIASPKTMGAMPKAPALNPAATLNLDLSRWLISLKN